jgi:hypothetical protein
MVEFEQSVEVRSEGITCWVKSGPDTLCSHSQGPGWVNQVWGRSNETAMAGGQ